MLVGGRRDPARGVAALAGLGRRSPASRAREVANGGSWTASARRLEGDGPWRLIGPMANCSRSTSARLTGEARRGSCRRIAPPSRARSVEPAGRVDGPRTRPVTCRGCRSSTTLVTAQPSAPCAVTIGAYDGVHIGHRLVIDRVRRVAAEQDLASAVVTFDQHPAAVVRPESAPRLLPTWSRSWSFWGRRGSTTSWWSASTRPARRSRPRTSSGRSWSVASTPGPWSSATTSTSATSGRGNVAMLQDMGAEFGFDVTGLRLFPGGPGRPAGVLHPHPGAARRPAPSTRRQPCWGGPTRCGAS